MAAVKQIPEGYHAVTPYLNINGAEKVIDFAKKTFGAEEKFRMPLPDGRIAHAELRIADSTVMVSDAIEFPPQPGSLYVYVPDVDSAYKRGIAAGGKSQRPPEDKFYGDRSASVIDPSGNIWSIATHKEDVPPPEIEKRARAEMSKKR